MAMDQVERANVKKANEVVSVLKKDNGKITGPLTPEIEAKARELAEKLSDQEKNTVLAKLDLLKTDVQKNKMDGIKNILNEGNDDISPDELERAITMSEEYIKAVPSVDLQNTLRGVHGAIIVDTLRSHEHNLHINNGQIVIEPKPGTDVVNLQEKLRTLVNTGHISLDILKIGLLYSSPTFGKYSQLKKTPDGKIDPKVDNNDFNRYLRDLSTDQQAAPDVKSLLESRDMLNDINIQQAIRSYQDMGQAGAWTQAHPEIYQTVATAVAASQSASTNPVLQSASEPVSHTTTETPAPANNTSNTTPNIVQNSANAVTGKAGEFAGNVADNIGGFAGGVSQALSKGFEKGGAIGGIAVAVIGIMGAWKFLTGEWGTKNHKLSGWMVALLGFGGKAAYDMASEYGLIDKAKDAAGSAANKVKSKASGATSTPSSDSADADSTKPEKPVAKTTETQGISPSQLEATKTVEKNDDLRKSLDGKNPGISEYLNFIHKEISGIPMEKLINDSNTSIFDPAGAIDPAIKENLGTINPITLKKVLRAYLGANVILSISSGKQPGVVEKENFMKEKIDQKGMNAESIKTKTLAELTTTLYASSKVESTNLSPEIINKIKSYKLAHAGKELPKDNLDISVDPEMYEDNTYGVTLAIKNPKLLNQNISSVEPIIVYFDKTGNLLTDTVVINTNIPAMMGGEPQYLLKQNGDTIGMIKA